MSICSISRLLQDAVILLYHSVCSYHQTGDALCGPFPAGHLLSLCHGSCLGVSCPILKACLVQIFLKRARYYLRMAPVLQGTLKAHQQLATCTQQESCHNEVGHTQRLTSTLNPSFCSISFLRGEADASSNLCWFRADRCSIIILYEWISNVLSCSEGVDMTSTSEHEKIDPPSSTCAKLQYGQVKWGSCEGIWRSYFFERRAWMP